MLIWPCLGSCGQHRDTKNCGLYAYSKTGCSNFIINDNNGNIFLLQVLVNFRNSIELFIFPYHANINAIVSNLDTYLSKLKQEYHLGFTNNLGQSSRHKNGFLD